MNHMELLDPQNSARMLDATFEKAVRATGRKMRVMATLWTDRRSARG